MTEAIAALDLAHVLAYALSLLLTGAVAGFAAGLLGVGGGIVIVPVLFYVFSLLGIDEDVKMHIAVGTSLSTIIATSTMSVRTHHRKGAIDVAMLKRWFAATVAGVAVGSFLAAYVEGDALTAVFGTVALFVAAHMAFSRPTWRLSDHPPTGLAEQFSAFAIGTVSAMMGIGGGTLSVPFLTLFNVPIHRAVGTAAAIGLVIGVPGTIGFVLGGLGVPDRPPFSFGYVSLIGLALILPTSMLMAPYGARAAHALPVRKLKLAFAAFLFITGLRMLSSALT